MQKFQPVVMNVTVKAVGVKKCKLTITVIAISLIAIIAMVLID